MNSLDVSSETVDSPVHTSGVDHVTVWGSNAETVLGFYRDVLGMRLVLRQPNLDDPSQTHLFLDAGDGRILTFFVNPDRPRHTGPQRVSTGGVHHLAFRVPAEEFEGVARALEDEGRGYNVFDRGIFHSLYTRDPDGLVVEITTDRYDFADERRADVLAETQRIREEEGADYAEAEHLRQALENLDVEYTENELPDVESGVGGL